MAIIEGNFFLHAFFNFDLNYFASVSIITTCQQVQWDEPASIPRPDRVSPWEIEPFAVPIPPTLAQPVAAKNKRPRPPAEIPALGEKYFSLFVASSVIILFFYI